MCVCFCVGGYNKRKMSMERKRLDRRGWIRQENRTSAHRESSNGVGGGGGGQSWKKGSENKKCAEGVGDEFSCPFWLSLLVLWHMMLAQDTGAAKVCVCACVCVSTCVGLGLPLLSHLHSRYAPLSL